MKIKYIDAKKEDAELLVNIYNASFYDDYIKYGECPGYGRTKERMEESIANFPKLIIYSDEKAIGTEAIKFMMDYYKDWSIFTLITPADNEGNINFYTKKCGFKIQGFEMDGNVKVVRFIMKR